MSLYEPTSESFLWVHVAGIPGPQGSKSAFLNRKTGRIVVRESSAKVKPWREAVKSDVVALLPDGWDGYGAYKISLDFVFVRPKSHYRTGRNAALLRDAAPIRPSGKPDLDKLVRSTMDGLTFAGVWADDSRVVSIMATKSYGERPGCTIAVRRVDR